MSTKINLSIVILSAVILSACTTKTPTTTGGESETVKPTVADQAKATSLRDLMGMGQNQKCTFLTTDTDTDGNRTDTSGTLYISGKRIAEEVQILSPNNEALNTNMMMVSDGTKIYTWNPIKKTQGMMFSMVNPTDTTESQTQNQNVDLDKKVDMKCSPWTVDEVKLTVPTDVKFTDLSELMKNIPTRE